MGVDLSRRDVLVTQQFLHRADVVSSLQQVCRERVPKSVRRNRSFDAGGTCSCAHLALNTFLVDMMTSQFASPGIDRGADRREHVLPAPLQMSAWILAIQCVG